MKAYLLFLFLIDVAICFTSMNNKITNSTIDAMAIIDCLGKKSSNYIVITDDIWSLVVGRTQCGHRDS